MKKSLVLSIVLCIAISLVAIPTGTQTSELTIEQLKSTIALGEVYTIKGTATGVDNVDIIIIGPDGCRDTPLIIENGFYHGRAEVAEDDTFEKSILIPEGADLGEYVSLVLAPGEDRVYGNTSYGAGDLIFAVLEANGMEMKDFIGKSREDIADFIEDTIINRSGLVIDEIEVVIFNVEPVSQPTPSIPAFQIIPAIVGLLAVAYILRRRK